MKKEKDMLSAWEYKNAAGMHFKGAFANRVNAALIAGARDGATSVSVNLPPAYRALTKKGAALRGKMESKFKLERYAWEYRKKDGSHWWDEDGIETAYDKALGEAARQPWTVEITPKERDY